MEKAANTGRVTRVLVALLALGAMLGIGALPDAGSGAGAQSVPNLPVIAKDCADTAPDDTLLPNSAKALQERHKIKILAIGASSAAVLGPPREGNPPLLEQILETTIKGLDVEIINRGFSGELADATAERLKIEVALNEPDMVIWQVGTNDALAQVPVETFEEAVTEMVRWLKDHNVDVILVGLHYTKQLAKNPHYQAIRTALRRIATAENVPRIGRYEAMEVLARALRATGQTEPRDLALSEAGYNCMAHVVARAIAVGLYANPRRFAPSSGSEP